MITQCATKVGKHFKYIALLILITQTLSGQSWLGSWENRQPISVINYNYQALQDYQTRFDITYQESMSSTFDDIRFTNATGTELMPYWIEYFEEGVKATIWVKIDTIPPFGEGQFYMYFGNPTAENVSNPQETFIFFDDFEEDTGWNMIGADTTTTIMEMDSTTSTIQKFDACGYEGSWKSIGDTISNFKLITRDFMPADTDDECTIIEYGVESSDFSGFNLRRDANGLGTSTEFGLEKRDDQNTSNSVTSLFDQPVGHWYRTTISYCHICHFNLHASIQSDSMSLIGEVYSANYETYDFSRFTMRGGHTYNLDYIAIAKNLCIAPVMVYDPVIETCPVATLVEFAHDLCEEGLGEITLSVSGGVAPYIINWYNGQDSLGTTTLDSAGIMTIDSLGAGEYCFKIIDAEGCEN